MFNSISLLTIISADKGTGRLHLYKVTPENMDMCVDQLLEVSSIEAVYVFDSNKQLVKQIFCGPQDMGGLPH